LDNLALVVADDVGHVVLDDGCQGFAVSDRVHPRRHLLVPEQSMTTHDLSILLSEGDDLVGVGVAELSAACYMRRSVSATKVLVDSVLTLNSIPFHAVLACDLSEGVLDDGGQGGVGQMVVVDLSAEVELSLGLELVVQALAEHNSRS
jgi:hypothetical protein